MEDYSDLMHSNTCSIANYLYILGFKSGLRFCQHAIKEVSREYCDYVSILVWYDGAVGTGSFILVWSYLVGHLV